MTDMTPERARDLLEGDLAGTKLACSKGGYGVIYIAPIETEDTAVAVPVRDKNMGWHKANPEVYAALVERFNIAPDLARAYLAEHAARVGADMALALVVERAGDIYAKHEAISLDHWAETPDQWRWHIYRNIRALAPASGVEDLAKLRAERDDLAIALQAAKEIIDEYYTDRDRLAAKLAEAEAQVAALREARRDQIEARVEAVIRRNFVAPEDTAVEALCVRFGYGAVMDAASRLWARRDMLGAFYIGGCIGFHTEEEARAALAARVAELEALVGAGDPATNFDRADWFWRTMDPDDCGDNPAEAINRAMVGRFCVCEVASSYAGPTRYGFIAPVLDPESDDEEFVHFATQQEAITEAKRRAALAARGAELEAREWNEMPGAQ